MLTPEWVVLLVAVIAALVVVRIFGPARPLAEGLYILQTDHPLDAERVGLIEQQADKVREHFPHLHFMVLEKGITLKPFDEF